MSPVQVISQYQPNASSQSILIIFARLFFAWLHARGPHAPAAPRGPQQRTQQHKLVRAHAFGAVFHHDISTVSTIANIASDERSKISLPTDGSVVTFHQWCRRSYCECFWYLFY